VAVALVEQMPRHVLVVAVAVAVLSYNPTF
jgi:hypothetical protein